MDFEIGWDDGRFPLNRKYHLGCNYVHIAARVNPDAAVTVYDSARR